MAPQVGGVEGRERERERERQASWLISRVMAPRVGEVMPLMVKSLLVVLKQQSNDDLMAPQLGG